MITKSRLLGNIAGPTSFRAGFFLYDRWEDGDPNGLPLPDEIWNDEWWPEPEYPPGDFAVTSLGSEQIEYSTRQLHNVCLHSRKYLEVFDEPYRGWTRSSSGPWDSERWRAGIGVEHPASLCGVYEHGIAGRSEFGSLQDFAVPWAPTWEADFSSLALRTMWPGTQSKAPSLANFLLELGDVKHLVSLARKIRKTFTRVPQLVRAFGRPRNRGDLLRLLRQVERSIDPTLIAAEAHLAVEFGIKPFVADCRRIYVALQGVEDEVRRIRANTGKRLTSHYQWSIPVPAVSNIATLDVYHGVYNQWRITRQVKNTLAEYHATMEYSYELKPGLTGDLFIDVALDRLGLNLNPAIPWNAYPWTFVVDWVCRIGDFLDQFQIRNIRPIVTILGFCHSVKYVRTTELLLQQNTWDNSFVQPVALVARETQSSYLRKPYVPSYYSALQLSGISTREFALSASLTRVRKRRSH